MESQIYSVKKGQGCPIVFLHGFCQTHDVWNELQNALSLKYNVICPDLPGFGLSPLPPKEISIEYIADALKVWLDEQKVTQCVIIGHSLGGYVALAMAERYPDLPLGLGLFNSTAFQDTDERKRNRKKMIAFVEKFDIPYFMKTFIPDLFFLKNRSRLEGEIEKLIQTANQTSFVSFKAYMIAMMRRSERIHVWESFQRETLFIAGKQDTSIPISLSLQQADLSKNSNVLVLDNVAHMAMLEVPEKVLPFIQNFIEKITKNTTTSTY